MPIIVMGATTFSVSQLLISGEGARPGGGTGPGPGIQSATMPYVPATGGLIVKVKPVVRTPRGKFCKLHVPGAFGPQTKNRFTLPGTNRL